MLQDKVAPKGFFVNWENSMDDFRRILTFENLPAIVKVAAKKLTTGALDVSCRKFLHAVLRC